MTLLVAFGSRAHTRPPAWVSRLTPSAKRFDREQARSAVGQADFDEYCSMPLARFRNHNGRNGIFSTEHHSQHAPDTASPALPEQSNMLQHHTSTHTHDSTGCLSVGLFLWEPHAQTNERMSTNHLVQRNYSPQHECIATRGSLLCNPFACAPSSTAPDCDTALPSRLVVHHLA